MSTTQNEDKFIEKILMHSAKYSTSSINGILLGNDSGLVLDAVPLCHNNLSLLPVVEIGLSIIENYSKKNKLQIIGYYFANERENDTEVSEVHLNIYKKIQKNFTNAVMWRVRKSN
jgi:ER membrane protein complex subunit 8/9